MKCTTGTLALVLLAATASVSGAPAAAKAGGKRNLILMISDGFGMTSEAMARTYAQQTGAENDQMGDLMDSLLRGTVRTTASNSLVTDSAAGATAYSCGLKTYNGAIGVDPKGRPCGTVLEAAKARGFTTALVTTSRITHATPASFAAHVANRDMEDLIAQQLVGLNRTGGHAVVDLMYGGGRCHFLPHTDKASCRSDSANVWEQAQQRGFHTVDSRAGFDTLNANGAKLPLLALFSDDHMAYEIDREPEQQPSLAEMTTSALRIVGRNAAAAPEAPGFFIMIEGARIDMAGHDNDPATQVRDVAAYWDAVAAAKAYVARHPDTLLVSTSDHETGGLALGIDGEYLWYPEVLTPVTQSAESLCHDLRQEGVDVPAAIKAAMPESLGIQNGTSTEIAKIAAGVAKGTVPCKMAVGGVVSRRAYIGWSTGGHTGTTVGLFAHGKYADKLHGNIDNANLGRFLAAYLGVDTRPITAAIQDTPTQQPGFKSQVRLYHTHN
ncbi:vacuolar alkaline phosphatase [Coemansia spiralis]|nr:vacuolar alkaline phosphatase [Coemansia spiralis]